MRCGCSRSHRASRLTLAWIVRGKEMPRGLERIDCPFGVIWGTPHLLLPRRQGPRWLRYVRGAELIELPRLGHVPMSDDPGAVAARVMEVTAALARPRPRQSAA